MSEKREWAIYRTDETGQGGWSLTGNLTWLEAEMQLPYYASMHRFVKIDRA